MKSSWSHPFVRLEPSFRPDLHARVSIGASSPEGGGSLYPNALLTRGKTVIRSSDITVTGGTGGSGLYQMNGTLDVSSTRIAVRGGSAGWGLVASLNNPSFRETRVLVEGTEPGAGQIVGVQVAGTTFDHSELSANRDSGASGATRAQHVEPDGSRRLREFDVVGRQRHRASSLPAHEGAREMNGVQRRQRRRERL